MAVAQRCLVPNTSINLSITRFKKHIYKLRNNITDVYACSIKKVMFMIKPRL